MFEIEYNKVDQEFIATTLQMVTGEPGIPTEKSVAIIFSQPHRRVYVFPEGNDYFLIHEAAIHLHSKSGYPPPQLVYLLGACRQPGCGCGRLCCHLSVAVSGGFTIEALGDFAFEELEIVLKAILLQVNSFFGKSEPTMVEL
jgi:hypothetical protein